MWAGWQYRRAQPIFIKASSIYLDVLDVVPMFCDCPHRRALSAQASGASTGNEHGVLHQGKRIARQQMARMLLELTKPWHCSLKHAQGLSSGVSRKAKGFARVYLTGERKASSSRGLGWEEEACGQSTIYLIILRMRLCATALPYAFAQFAPTTKTGWHVTSMAWVVIRATIGSSASKMASRPSSFAILRSRTSCAM
jgi:hypothetical protein